jgi:hypothetical protein
MKGYKYRKSVANIIKNNVIKFHKKYKRNYDKYINIFCFFFLNKIMTLFFIILAAGILYLQPSIILLAHNKRNS